MTESPDSDKMGTTAMDDATILVVDDEQALLDSFQQAIERAGYDVRTARNGVEALTELGPDVDIALLDRRMPGLTGYDMLEHIQTWYSDCHVVMVTAVDPGVDVVDMEIDDYLTKPVDKSELVGTIDQLLRFEAYEELLQEFHSLTKKYATLRATLDDETFRNDESVQDLRERRQIVSRELEATAQEFSDEAVKELLQQAHGSLPEA